MRVPRTFLFVDLTGFTSYNAEHGDDAAGRLLSSFRSITRQVASDRGVRVAKWLGDGAMCVALEQADAITMALDMEHLAATECAPLALRAGIASGKALLFEGDDYVGSAVNLAARLCDAARTNAVLIPADQLEEIPEGVRAEPFGSLRLPGFPDPVDVVDISGTPTGGTASDASEIWTRSPFVA